MISEIKSRSDLDTECAQLEATEVQKCAGEEAAAERQIAKARKVRDRAVAAARAARDTEVTRRKFAARTATITALVPHQREHRVEPRRSVMLDALATWGTARERFRHELGCEPPMRLWTLSLGAVMLEAWPHAITAFTRDDAFYASDFTNKGVANIEERLARAIESGDVARVLEENEALEGVLARKVPQLDAYQDPRAARRWECMLRDDADGFAAIAAEEREAEQEKLRELQIERSRVSQLVREKGLSLTEAWRWVREKIGDGPFTFSGRQDL